MLLLVRLVIVKTEVAEVNQFEKLGILFQENSTIASRSFFGYNASAAMMGQLRSCLKVEERGTTKKRLYVGLAPNTSSVITSLATRLTTDFGNQSLLIRYFPDAESMKSASAESNYEKDSTNPGMCFGVVVEPGQTASNYKIKYMFEDQERLRV